MTGGAGILWRYAGGAAVAGLVLLAWIFVRPDHRAPAPGGPSPDATPDQQAPDESRGKYLFVAVTRRDERHERIVEAVVTVSEDLRTQNPLPSHPDLKKLTLDYGQIKG